MFILSILYPVSCIYLWIYYLVYKYTLGTVCPFSIWLFMKYKMLWCVSMCLHSQDHDRVFPFISLHLLPRQLYLSQQEKLSFINYDRMAAQPLPKDHQKLKIISNLSNWRSVILMFDFPLTPDTFWTLGLDSYYQPTYLPTYLPLLHAVASGHCHLTLQDTDWILRLEGARDYLILDTSRWNKPEWFCVPVVLCLSPSKSDVLIQWKKNQFYKVR